MTTCRAALIGCSRMGAFIDSEMPPDNHRLPYSHAAGYTACDRTDLIGLSRCTPGGDGPGRYPLQCPPIKTLSRL